MVERVLSLDMSTKTGYSLLLSGPDGYKLEAWGQLPQIHMPEGAYPQSFIVWAHKVFHEVMILISKYTPTVLVIEETAAGSKAIYTQKILEWIHFLLASYIKESNIKAVYLMTEQWRRITGCYMSKDESKHNKKVKTYKDKNDTRIAYDENKKRIGKITRKHVNIRRANEVFGEFLGKPLRKKDEDTADSILLGYAYHVIKMNNEVKV